jgi:alkanesulfonate monooxygenase SsuD/methylene tetrahydromethanopterin reductase-like flavin-dependent oxidoreductase (luciferase family)
MATRWGMTVPFAGVPLSDHARAFSALADAGFTDVWSAEVAGTDAFTPLALAALWEPQLRLGTAIAPVFTRGPSLLAMSAAALAETAPGRFQLGIGASSPVVVGDWNAVDFAEPFERSRDMLRFLKPVLAGEMVDHDYGTFAVRRFKLERPPAIPPQVLLAALRPGMLRLAAAEADGVILNWLAATDVPTVLAETKQAQSKQTQTKQTQTKQTGAEQTGTEQTDAEQTGTEQAEAGSGFDVVARIFVCPTADADYARNVGRRLIAAYLTVPAYAAFHRWLGRESVLTPIWRAWSAGDRKAALAAIPDSLVDELIMHGAPAACRDKVDAYAKAGVTVPVMALLPTPDLTPDALPAMISALGR